MDKTNKINKIDNYTACMVLHAVGDTIGFKNGKWEFMKTLDKVYEFIDIGGVNHLSLKGWRVSDDTILHMKTAEALLEQYNSLNTLCEIATKKYIGAYDEFNKEGLTIRYPGVTSMDSLGSLKKGRKWTDTPYDFHSGGSGASMRSPCIGLAYHGEENRQKLIQVAIETSRITHNSVVGYLGGLTSALFTAYAIEGVDIRYWPKRLLELLKDGTVSKYIKKAGRDVKNYEDDVHVFIDKWELYIQDKFDDKGDIKKKRSHINLFLRSEYYHNNFGYKMDKDGKEFIFPGSGGDDSVIIAYDSLIDAGTSWEKLIFYSMLHMGDTDTTGCIAGAWWGALHGYKDVPKLTLEYVEFKDSLEKMGHELYEKYG